MFVRKNLSKFEHLEDLAITFTRNTAQNGISHTLYRIIDLRFFTRKCDSRVLLVCIIGIMTILIHKINQKATNRFGTRKPENRIEVNHGQIFEKSRFERPKCKGSGRWASEWSKTSKRDLGAREQQILSFRIDSTDHSLFYDLFTKGNYWNPVENYQYRIFFENGGAINFFRSKSIKPNEVRSVKPLGSALRCSGFYYRIRPFWHAVLRVLVLVHKTKLCLRLSGKAGNRF